MPPMAVRLRFNSVFCPLDRFAISSRSAANSARAIWTERARAVSSSDMAPKLYRGCSYGNNGFTTQVTVYWPRGPWRPAHLWGLGRSWKRGRSGGDPASLQGRLQPKSRSPGVASVRYLARFWSDDGQTGSQLL